MRIEYTCKVAWPKLSIVVDQDYFTAWGAFAIQGHQIAREYVVMYEI